MEHARGEEYLGLVGALTDAIDRVTDEIGDLGPRMLLYRMPDVDEDAAMVTAARNAGHQSEMRARLADCVSRLRHRSGLWWLAARTATGRTRLSGIGSRGRVVPVTGPSRPMGGNRTRARPEAGMRVYASLPQLTAGAFTIGLDDASTDSLVRRVAVDSKPAVRRRVLDELLSGPPGQTTRTLADAVGLPTSIVDRVCHDLAALGVLQRGSEAVGSHQHHQWFSDEARTLTRDARLHPSL